jgi:hypothetical protein
MTKEKKVRLPYERPILNHLDEVAHGGVNCTPGSGAAGSCQNGAGAVTCGATGAGAITG